jgi:DMSO reductase anchor subunit
MDIVLSVAELLVPLVIALVTVPVVNVLKRLHTRIEESHAAVKQVAAVLVAAGLTWVAGVLQTPLPEALHLIEAGHVEAVLSAALAMAIHAGRK